jgi:hypothetical protein
MRMKRNGDRKTRGGWCEGWTTEKKKEKEKLKQANSRKNAGAGEGGINSRWCVWEVRGFVEWDDGHFFFFLCL